MTRFLTLALVLSGCVIGTSGSELFQAEGVTVAVEFQQRGQSRVITGELLAVEADGYLVDAIDDTGAPARTVRVPFRVIYRGEVYTGGAAGTAATLRSFPPMSPEERVRADRRPRSEFRQVGRLLLYGTPKGKIDLRALSRFPDGIPAPLLARLLEARGQDAVLPHTDAPSRPASL